MTTLNSETLTPLETDAISLKFEDGIAFVKVSGKVGKEEMGEAIDWLVAANDAHESYNMCVDIAKMDFPDLGAISAEFRRLGDMWRTAKALDKCAVLTDSKFLQSSAKVEGAVIPGLEIQSFDLEDLSPALRWLHDGEMPKAQADTASAAPAKNPMDVDLASMYG